MLAVLGTSSVLAAPTSTQERLAAFRRVYNEGTWLNGPDGGKCRSGWSSVMHGQALPALDFLMNVTTNYNVSSLIDVPCGDGCFTSAILSGLRRHNPDFRYVGIDLLQSLVTENRQRMGGPSTQFVQADVATLTMLPGPSELVLSRQMTQHMCNNDVNHFLELVSRSGARFALLTTFFTDGFFSNEDIPCASGHYRPMDLTKPPFSLIPPIRFISERYPLDTRVGLGLWRLPLTRKAPEELEQELYSDPDSYD